MASLTSIVPSGLSSVIHLRIPIQTPLCCQVSLWRVQPTCLPIQVLVWLADWRYFFKLLMFIATRIAVEQLVHSRSNNHVYPHRWEDYMPFQQFPTLKNMTSFWSVHSNHWTSAVSSSNLSWASASFLRIVGFRRSSSRVLVPQVLYVPSQWLTVVNVLQRLYEQCLCQFTAFSHGCHKDIYLWNRHLLQQETREKESASAFHTRYCRNFTDHQVS